MEKNAPGDFYTTGECLSCELPESIAPGCLAPLNDANYETYFLRQPQTAEEIEHVCAAAESCCVNAIRYGGRDPAIIARLGNHLDYCDHVLPGPRRGSRDWQRERHAGVGEKRWWQFWR